MHDKPTNYFLRDGLQVKTKRLRSSKWWKKIEQMYEGIL